MRALGMLTCMRAHDMTIKSAGRGGQGVIDNGGAGH